MNPYSMKPVAKEAKCIIIYDSACPQCSWFIKKLSFEADASIISLSSLQAEEHYENEDISLNPKTSDTMIVLNGEEELLYWSALNFCVKHSNFPQWLKKVITIIPERIGNLLYRILFFVRQRTRSKNEGCKLP
jgi:predicted DCC family thiol-disulfide oxidoreductase YuxK